MPAQDANYRFGPFELRTRTRDLYKGGMRLKLRPQPFQLLLALLERSGDVVTREELRRLLWPEGTFVDFEHGLNTSIKELRGLLNDSASEPRYIQTLPKLGYRFITSVQSYFPVTAKPEVVQQEAPRRESEPAQASATRAEASSPDSWPAVSRPRGLLVIGITALVIASLAGYIQWSRSHSRAQPSSGRAMLAVLPFENLTGDASEDYFSDGLTEEMVGQLGQLDPQHIGVIARTSVMHYKHTQEPLDQIGRELGVQYVLEGSVRRDTQNVRISAQLIQVKDQTHLWSRQYDRQLSSLLALQGEIAQEIADEIQLTLGRKPGPKAAGRQVASPAYYEAYDLYLRGRYFWNKRTGEGFQQAAESFQQAVAKDANYARAYAGLADTYALMSTWGQVPQSVYMPKAREAVLAALHIDEGLAEGHTSLALIAENYDYDWQTAEKEYLRAIQLDPSYATAHQWYAECLSFEGRFEEALAESERARQLDPLSLIIAADHGAILYFSRQYDRAIEQFRAVLAMDPNFPRASMVVGAYVQAGRFPEALTALQDQRRNLGLEDPLYIAAEVYLYGRSGRREQAQHALEKLEQAIRKVRSDTTVPRLTAYLGTDRKDEVITLLQKAFSEHSNAVITMKVDPIFDPLRADPRFQDLLRRVHLSQ